MEENEFSYEPLFQSSFNELDNLRIILHLSFVDLVISL